MYMYKEDLALNNLHGLICHKPKPHQLNQSISRCYKYTVVYIKNIFALLELFFFSNHFYMFGIKLIIEPLSGLTWF